jgi:heme/copper-type cytochrome/quinol oxidase subunit 2
VFAIFWLFAALFLVVQSGMLCFLLFAGRFGRGAAHRETHERHLEIVWTLVPASILVALVLMMYGLTGSSWTHVRGEGELAMGVVPGVTTTQR